MKSYRSISAALAAGMFLFGGLTFGASAVPFNITIGTDDTGTVPLDVAPPAPIASPFTFGTTFTGVIGDSLSPPVYRSPFEGTGQFLTAAFSSVEGPPPVGGSSAAYAVGTGNALQIFWGSVDKFNTLAFYNGSTLVGSLTGADLSPLNFGAGHDLVSLLVSSIFDTVVISSSINAFEFSNVAVSCIDEARACEPPLATPLPAALPLFVSGIAGLGGLVGWRRRRKTAKAVAA